MQLVQQWQEGRHPFIQLVGILSALDIDDHAVQFSQIKDRKMFKHQFPLPSFSSWFQFYSCPNRLLEFLDSLFAAHCSRGDDLVNIADYAYLVTHTVREIIEGKRTKIPDISEGTISSFIEGFITALRAEDSSEAVIDENPEAYQHFLEHQDGGAFLALVTLPCLVLYQRDPWTLYQEAISGDVDALEKLMRLDSLLLHDHLIGEQLQRLRYKKVTQYERIIRASLDPPKPKATRKRILISAAGAISAFAQKADIPLTEPDVRTLMDAISLERRGEEDPDVPEYPDSFYRDIKRSRESWLKALNQLSRT